MRDLSASCLEFIAMVAVVGAWGLLLIAYAG